MRRFSQRNSLVTLSDINITPLLDLAFVLLIIFVIISPSIRSAHEQSIKLNLPKGGQPDKTVDAKDVMTVEINSQGQYFLGGRPMAISKIEADLTRAREANPKLVVAMRADKKCTWEMTHAVFDICQSHNILCSIKSEPKTPR